MRGLEVGAMLGRRRQLCVRYWTSEVVKLAILRTHDSNNYTQESIILAASESRVLCNVYKELELEPNGEER